MKGFFKKEIIDGRECLVPANQHTLDSFKKLKFNRWYKAEVKVPRNVKHNAKYWCLVTEVAEHSDYTPMELHERIKFKVGHYDIVGEIEGHYLTKSRSTDFPSTNQTEFDEFYDRALDILMGDKLGITLTKEQMDDLASKAYSGMERTYKGG